MCDPVSATIAATTAAIKIGGAIADHKAQNKQASAVQAAALDSMRIQDHELSLQEVQSRIAGSQQVDQGNREVQAASGDVAASAATRGVGGMSIDLLLNDVLAQGARFKTSVDQNTDAQVQQVDSQKDAALAEARGRIAGAPKASMLATGLKIGAAGLDAYNTLKIQRKTS
jgi:hypothetical protein